MSGNSITHGPHHVAQTLTRRSFFPPSLRASALTPASSIVSRVTGSCAHFSYPSFTQGRLSDHLTEQPKTLVVSTGTGFPARTASMALRASCVVTFAGFSPSSTRPTKRSFRSASKTKTCGVATGPYCRDIASVSPS